jgi:hypothetical protein
MDEPEEESRESGGTTLQNKGRDAGWYLSSNALTDKWARIIGPQAFLIYHTFKSLCRGQEERPFPRVRQVDWAEYMGMGLQVYQRSLKILTGVGLLSVIQPTGEDRLQHKPSKIILNDLEAVSITPELLTTMKVKRFSDSCRFNDPLFDSPVWQASMFRKETTMRRTIPPPKSTGCGDIKNNMSGGIEGNGSNIKGQNIKEQYHTSYDIKSSGEPCIPEEPSTPSQKTTSPMQDRIAQKIRSRSPQKTKQEEPLPPIDQMPAPLQAWYQLPLVRHHKAKAYHQCVRLIDRLKQGQFPTKISSLKKEWADKYNISSASLVHRWTDQKLVQVIQRFRLMLEDAAYWPQDKHKVFKGYSFIDFVWRRYSGISWLLALKDQEPGKLTAGWTGARSKGRREILGFQRQVESPFESFDYSTCV